MRRQLHMIIAAGAMLSAFSATEPACAQKQGGILRQYMIDSPASMSIHEETTVVGERPVMAVMNNLVLFDQNVPQNSLSVIKPELATDWAWDEDGTKLTFHLRQGVKWHDGKPFTAADVKCTWDLVQGKTAERLRVNPRKAWYNNLSEIVPNGDYEVTFVLKRPQPAFIALLATGMSPVYPCHISPAQMRQHPIGTGPFKFVEFRPNEFIKVVKNPDYWKPGVPHLDAIEYTILRNRSTAILAFAAGKYELTFAGTLTIPLTRDLQKQRPDAICELPPGSVSANLIINREKPPFNNPELRRAKSLALARQAFIDILTDGQGSPAAAMQPPPGGQWGMPLDMLEKLPGYEPDVAANRDKAREIMKKLGYGPDKRMNIKVTTRDIPPYRDPAVILIDQLERRLHRGRARAGGYRPMVPQGSAQGLRRRSQPDRHLHRRSRCDAVRELCLRRCRQLQRLLQRRDRQADRPAIDGSGPGKTQAHRLGNRAPACRG